VFAKPNQTKGLMFNDLFKFENERDWEMNRRIDEVLLKFRIFTMK
jgi:hypothetical protein